MRRKGPTYAPLPLAVIVGEGGVEVPRASMLSETGFLALRAELRTVDTANAVLACMAVACTLLASLDMLRDRSEHGGARARRSESTAERERDGARAQRSESAAERERSGASTAALTPRNQVKAALATAMPKTPLVMRSRTLYIVPVGSQNPTG